MSTKEERRSSYSHYGGKETGIEECAGTLRKMAADFYVSHNDLVAGVLCTLTDDLEARARDVRKEQDKYRSEGDP